MAENKELLEFAARGPLEFICYVVMCLLIAFTVYFAYRSFRDLEAYFIERKYLEHELKDGEEPREEETVD